MEEKKNTLTVKSQLMKALRLLLLTLSAGASAYQLYKTLKQMEEASK